MLREAYCTDAMKTFECQKVYEGQEDMKIDKKNWMANKLSDSSNTDRKVSYTLQQKNWTDTEKL